MCLTASINHPPAFPSTSLSTTMPVYWLIGLSKKNNNADIKKAMKSTKLRNKLTSDGNQSDLSSTFTCNFKQTYKTFGRKSLNYVMKCEQTFARKSKQTIKHKKNFFNLFYLWQMLYLPKPPRRTVSRIHQPIVLMLILCIIQCVQVLKRQLV